MLFLAGFLFATAATVHDYVKGLEFERIPFQTQVVIILALLAAFLLFAGLSVFLTERRKIGLLFWSGLVVLGVIGTGYIMAYVWEGGLLREALPSVPITTTPVPTPMIGSTPEATSTPGPTSPPTVVITYTVQPGDTLAKIAAEFGVAVEALVEANDIEDPSLINAGQVLVIPQP
ncbi:MAG: LysM peptidoglycan-binding domain-containing protein [Anaerolineae bacterium]